MRITQFTHLRLAQAFVDYMATRGVTLRIEQEGGYTLWLDDESQLSVVENELNQFIREPDHPRYQAASWKTENTDSGIQYVRPAGPPLKERLKEMAGPLTIGVSVASILVYLLIALGGYAQAIAWLGWPKDSMQHFQVWRWFSHVLMNFSLLALLINLLWWFYIGGRIEKQLGSGKLFTIALISALLCGFAQSRFNGFWFGGLSGVDHALVAYAWLHAMRDERSPLNIGGGLMGIFVVWVVLEATGVFGANTGLPSHIAGLLVGLAMAFVDTRQKKR
ncbi:rhomboid family intramembrane serine protease GlpG [Erwinia sp. JUb26]|uniref:rhomboid family intramembrane serine protease GlpG n=1 Tax=Erwinia sp. JUb26 TaxID=2485126 RepID=UPI000F47576E|nr:rhomboid family intramembrane serine protease GlpG [Erwinia sp. JUb26]ROR13784.1 GlpG protein [Erwinia sp. JUb26]